MLSRGGEKNNEGEEEKKDRKEKGPSIKADGRRKDRLAGTQKTPANFLAPFFFFLLLKKVRD